MTRGRPHSRAKAAAKRTPKKTARTRGGGVPPHHSSAAASTRPSSSVLGTPYARVPDARVYLHVAEKPSVARELSTHLNHSGAVTTTMKSYSPYNKVSSFTGPPGFRDHPGPVVFLVTSVTGHLCSTDFFEPTLKQWNDTTTQQLFTARIHRFVPEKNQGIAKTLREASLVSTDLVLWLDCDREGENIAYEVRSVCLESNPHLQVHRAIFSSLAQQDVHRSLYSLTVPNPWKSAAVDARCEYDLRVGAIFTRLLSLTLKERLQLQGVISYGPCQFPALRIVVDRFIEMQSFQEESFWFLRPELPTTSSIPNSVRFLWNRRRLFDLNAVNGYKQIADTFLGNASITSLDQHPKRRWRPMPLTTVAMTTIAARKLRIASAETMRIAERLYQQGYVSYPRTETDSYPSSLPLLDILTTLSSHSSLGVFASSVIDSRNNNRGLGQPLNVRAASTVRSGSQSDEAHPPIHPVKNLEVSQALSIDPNAYRIYELIARHFIATLTEDAIGAETVATLGIGPESFSCTGLMILEKNFLEVYAPYESWSAKQIPTFHQNQQIAVQSISVVEGKTSRPEPYEEADLIGLMDRHGIGTDATMHDHIHTIQVIGFDGVR
eukprot:GHVH01006085.1.p1 GENE.GHVH01006085.1~~GHVH01006085.1.p1  ORF type:complete len:607 (-),score=69.68 GHVH01006085.1:548-2368(-)